MQRVQLLDLCLDFEAAREGHRDVAGGPDDGETGEALDLAHQVCTGLAAAHDGERRYRLPMKDSAAARASAAGLATG